MFALTGLLLSCVTSSTTVSPTTSALPDAAAPDGPGRLIVDLSDGTSLKEARQATGLALEWVDPRTADEALAVVEVADADDTQRRLQAMPLVEAVEPSLAVQALGYPDDPLYPRQWNLRQIDAPAGWRAGGGDGVIVAVIDTGVSPVPDLADTELLEGASFVPGVPTARDDNGHGTHVAGTIAQSTDNGLGVAGIAPRATVLPIKALTGSGSGQSEWIAAAIDEAVDQGAQVINLSLGGGDSRIIAVATHKAIAAGVVVVAAAGNTGREGVSCPANVPGVIAVSATGPRDKLAPYSSWGPQVGMAAPGGDKRQANGGILQDTIDAKGHAFKEYQGTSMATPHVAGAAAVLLGAGAPDADAVRDALEAGAVDLGAPGKDPRFGSGRLDLGASLRAMGLHARGLLFVLGGLVGWLLTRLGGLRSRGATVAAALTGAITAGGLFFLPSLPLPPLPLAGLLSRPLLLWPAAWLGTRLGSLPLFLSALLPALATLVLGPTRTLGPLVAGLAAGVGVHLLHGAVTGSLHAWPLPGTWGIVWLVVNGLISLLAGMATIGVLKMRETHD